MCGYSRDRRKKTQSIRTGEKFKFYLDGLDQVLEAEPLVIEGLNHAMEKLVVLITYRK